MIGAGVASSSDRNERSTRNMRSRNLWVAAILGLVALLFYVGFMLLHVLG
jgi:hypothetical protein